MSYCAKHKVLSSIITVIFLLQLFLPLSVFAGDTSKPVISVTPESGETVQKSYTITVTVTDEGSGLGEEKFRYYWSRSSKTDEKFSQPPGVIASNTAEAVSIQTPAGVEGEFYLHLKASDIDGNEAVKTAGPFCIDTLIPTVTLESDGFGEAMKEQSVRIFAYDFSGIKSMQARWFNLDTLQYGYWNYGIKSGTEITAPDEPGRYRLMVSMYDTLYNSGNFSQDVSDPIIVGTPDGSPSLSLDADNDTGDAFAMGIARVSAMIWDDNDRLDEMTILHKWSQDPDTESPEWDTDGYESTYGGYLRFSKNDGNGMWYLWVKVTDTDGNSIVKCSEGTPLDTKAPELSLHVFPKGPTASSVAAHVYADETLLDNSFEPEYNYFANGLLIFNENGDYTISASDLSYNSSDISLTVDNIDPALPLSEITYSNEEWTNETVTASVYAPDNCILLDPPDGFTITATDEEGNVKEALYEFAENGGVEFMIKDLSTGKTGWDAAWVFNIDKTPPIIRNVSYNKDTVTGSPVSAEITCSDFESGMSDSYWDDRTYSFEENGSHTFVLEDAAGNSAQRTVAVDWIDKDPIQASIDYESSGSPYSSVTASLNISSANGEVHMIQPAGGTAHVFTENGTYMFIYQDDAGHVGRTLAEVNWIGEYISGAVISYDITSPTNQPVTAAISFAESGVSVTNNGGSNSYTFYDNGTFTFEYIDGEGNTGSAVASVTWIDKELSAEASISYSTESLTNQDVTASISFSGSEDITVIGASTHTFSENGSHTFTYGDAAGNTRTLTADVTWIDKEVPSGTVNYDITWTTNQPVKATLHTTDNVGPVTVDGGSAEHIFVDNGQYIFTFSDGAGNSGSVTAEVYWIDGSAPQGVITYDEDSFTNEDVTAAINFQEPGIQITNNEEKNTYKFTENGSFTFEYRDEAGNSGSTQASVTWIDREPPSGTIEYVPSSATGGEVKAMLTVSDNSGITEITNGSSEHAFSENGEYTFTFKDAAGNEGSVTAKVDWIDREQPTGNVSYSTNEYTKDQVTAVLSLEDDGGPVTVTNGSHIHIFDENGEYAFTFIDSAGNTGSVTANVYWIDNEAPEADVHYSTIQWTGGGVTAELANIRDNSGQPVQIVGEGSYLFEGNGDHNFYIKDKAGNISQIASNVNWIDKSLPQPLISRSTASPTNQDVSCTITFITNVGREDVDHDVITILNNGGSDTFVFSENGTFTFEYSDQFGNTGSAEVSVNNIDKMPPAISVAFNNTNPTKDNVTATITITDVSYCWLSNAEPVKIDDNTYQMVFENNYTFSLRAVDIAGNITQKDITVDWINRSAPAASIVYSITTPTNENVEATVIFEEGAGDVTIITAEDELPQCAEVSGENKYLFKDNGSFVLKYTDAIGNMGAITLSVTWIDRVASAVSIEYTPENETPYAVYSCIKPGIGRKIYNEDGSEAKGSLYDNSMEYLFLENGTHTFVYYDELGNRGEATAEVNWIRSSSPKVRVDFDPQTPVATKGNVTAKLILENDYGKGFHITNNGGGNTYEFMENGSFTFEYENDLQEKSTKVVSVDWIDREPPVIDKIQYAPGGDAPVPTSANPIIYFHLHDNSREAGYVQSFIVKENGDYEFSIRDDAGNELDIPMKVDWIDREKPQLTIVKSTEKYTNGDVTVTINASEDIRLDIVRFDSTGHRTIYESGYSDRHEITVDKNCTLRLGYHDRALNSVWNYDYAIDNIDKQAPSLQLLKPPVFVTDDESKTAWEVVKPWVSASDNITEDILDKASMSLKEAKWNDKEDEIRTYELWLEDDAGNKSGIIPITYVVARRSYPTVFINGQDAADGVSEKIPEESSSVKVQVDFLGLDGEYTVKLADGERSSGYFKSAFNAPVIYNSRIVDGSLAPLELEAGVYTLYVYDQEMRGMCAVIRVE